MDKLHGTVLCSISRNVFRITSDKRHMSRKARSVLPAVPHHVVLRGNNRRRLFSYPHEYERFIFLLGRRLIVGDCALHAAALMTNHVHLVLTPATERALSSFVKTVAQRYAQMRNLARCGSGRLFEERYFSRPILSEQQLAVTIAYVELNPVRAGLASEPGAYRWSTFACHAPSAGVGAIPRGLWRPTDWYLGLSSRADEREAAYRAWLDECRARDERPDCSDQSDLRAAVARLAAKVRVERPDRSRAG